MAISGWEFLLLLFTQNPAGVAWVIGTVVTQPTFFPALLNFCRMGKYSSPFEPMFRCPLGTLCPPPQDELLAAESVTKELDDAVSINALAALWSLYKSNQCEPRPSLRRNNSSAILSVPVLIPSLTRKMIFLAVLPLPWPFTKSWLELQPCAGNKKELAAAPKAAFLKNSRRFIYILGLIVSKDIEIIAKCLMKKRSK